MIKRAARFLEKFAVFAIIRILWTIRPGWSTPLYTWYLAKNGAKITGRPNYLSAKIWFDGTDYSLIELGDGCTISSNVRILTHDWALNTVCKELGYAPERPLGKIRPISIGRNSFVGTGSIIMPGARIGHGCIIAAGSVVRGEVPSLTIFGGNPAVRMGDVREYVTKNLGGGQKPVVTT